MKMNKTRCAKLGSYRLLTHKSSNNTSRVAEQLLYLVTKRRAKRPRAPLHSRTRQRKQTGRCRANKNKRGSPGWGSKVPGGTGSQLNGHERAGMLEFAGYSLSGTALQWRRTTRCKMAAPESRSIGAATVLPLRAAAGATFKPRRLRRPILLKKRKKKRLRQKTRDADAKKNTLSLRPLRTAIKSNKLIARHGAPSIIRCSNATSDSGFWGF